MYRMLEAISFGLQSKISTRLSSRRKNSKQRRPENSLYSLSKAELMRGVLMLMMNALGWVYGSLLSMVLKSLEGEETLLLLPTIDLGN
jgi:hypothetical protein